MAKNKYKNEGYISSNNTFWLMAGAGLSGIGLISFAICLPLLGVMSTTLPLILGALGVISLGASLSFFSTPPIHEVEDFEMIYNTTHYPLF